MKAAALLQLDLHVAALEDGVTLSDASAYNVQFRGATPVFIDTLSFRRYRDGEFWLGHRQFCEQFLNPLLLRAKLGVPHNAWYRGALEGIAAHELAALLKARHKLSWNVLTHVVLPAAFQARGSAANDAARQVRERKLPLPAFRHMLRELRRWIERLEPLDTGRTVWADYATRTSYRPEEARAKRAFVAEFAAAVRPRQLWDVGCNVGDYAQAALEAGAGCAIGFDADHGALERAFARASAERLDFLPLYLDAANPAPAQGWAQFERHGLAQRARADAVLALALVHHLAIGRNVPLPAVVDWLVGLAPRGVVEFVPKDDPMVQSLLRLREDVFDAYREDAFASALGARAAIVRTDAVSSTGRRLYWFERR